MNSAINHLESKTTKYRMWDIFQINCHFSKKLNVVGNKTKNLKKCNHQMQCMGPNLIKKKKNYKHILGTIKKIWIFELSILGNEEITVNYLNVMMVLCLCWRMSLFLGDVWEWNIMLSAIYLQIQETVFVSLCVQRVRKSKYFY